MYNQKVHDSVSEVTVTANKEQSSSKLPVISWILGVYGSKKRKKDTMIDLILKNHFFLSFFFFLNELKPFLFKLSFNRI